MATRSPAALLVAALPLEQDGVLSAHASLVGVRDQAVRYLHVAAVPASADVAGQRRRLPRRVADRCQVPAPISRDAFSHRSRSRRVWMRVPRPLERSTRPWAET
jgi:hypothetical protein